MAAVRRGPPVVRVGQLGIELIYGPWDERKPEDVLAHHHGRAAAESISLALQLRPGAVRDAKPQKLPARIGYQMQLRF